MTSNSEIALGKALAQARLSGEPIDPPADWPPADPGSAERVQDAAADAMGEAVVGWKIGATSPEIISAILPASRPDSSNLTAGLSRIDKPYHG